MQSSERQGNTVNMSRSRADIIAILIVASVGSVFAFFWMGLLGMPTDIWTAFKVILAYNLVISLAALVIFSRISPLNFRASNVILLLVLVNMISAVLILNLNRTLDQSEAVVLNNRITGNKMTVREGALGIEWRSSLIRDGVDNISDSLVENINRALQPGLSANMLEGLSTDERAAYLWWETHNPPSSLENNLSGKLLKKEVWENGSYKSIMPFSKNGDIDGIAAYWFPDGSLYGFIPYDQGLKNGRFRLYRNDGSLEQDLSFKDGVSHGVSLWYKPDGSLEAAWLYVEGQARKDVSEFYERR